MNKPVEIVVFNLDDKMYAFHLKKVERIIRAVEITPLPKAPEIVLGAINVEGKIIPVVDIRKRFGLPEKEIELANQFVIVQTAKRLVAIVADSVDGVVFCNKDEIINGKTVLPNLPYVEGVISLEDGLVLIHDIDLFLSLEEEKTLSKVLKK